MTLAWRLSSTFVNKSFLSKLFFSTFDGENIKCVILSQKSQKQQKHENVRFSIIFEF